jgi:hypothetical protein
MKRSLWPLAGLAVFTLSACSLAPLGGATAGPSAEPSASAQASAIASPGATATPDATSPGATASTPAPDPTRSVVRIEMMGGFIPAEMTYRHYPMVALYEDGRLIEPGAEPAIYPGPALPTLSETRISADGVATILDWARAAGFDGPDRQIGQPVPDVGQTVYTVTYPDGTTHTTVAYPDFGDKSPDTAMAQALDFQHRLLDVNASLPPGDVGQSGEYDWTQLRVIWWPAQNSDQADASGATVKDWPLASLATLGEPLPADGFRCAAFTGSELATLLPAAQASNQATLWKSDDQLYQAIFHPLLPDDRACPTTRSY